MNGQAHILFDPQTACLTEQAMFDYLDGKLTPFQSHAVEKHLLDCAFCSEAMEGLELVKDRSKVSAFLPPLVTDKTEETDKGGKIIRFNFNPRLAAAAIIILLLGSFLLLRYLIPSNKQPDMVQTGNKHEEPQTTANPVVTTSEDETFYRNFEPFPAPEEQPGSNILPAPKEDNTALSFTIQTNPNQTRENDISRNDNALSSPPPPMASQPAAGAAAKPDDYGPAHKQKAKDDHAADQFEETILKDGESNKKMETEKDKNSEQLRKQVRETNSKNKNVMTDSVSAPVTLPAGGNTSNENSVFRANGIKSANDMDRATPANAPSNTAAYTKSEKKNRSIQAAPPSQTDQKTAPAKEIDNSGYFSSKSEGVVNKADSSSTLKKFTTTDSRFDEAKKTSAAEKVIAIDEQRKDEAPKTPSLNQTTVSGTSGGTGSYSYEWKNDHNQANLTGKISPGTYMVMRNPLMDEAMDAYKKKDFGNAASKFEGVL
ncbi:MAG TPA: zf-HC2 domain-containing protein, partial [Bacteroidia bacterium]|nr:zf-HC2 domain-containing protein [Bacteroidia bacterium]